MDNPLKNQENIKETQEKDKTKTLQAASVQFNHQPGDKEANFKRIEHFVKEASDKKVDLIAFPEMCITGYWHLRDFSESDLLPLSEPVPDGPSTKRLMALAKEFQMNIGAGLIEKGEDGKLYNTYVVAMVNGKIAKHRKIHCFINAHMASGKEYTVFDIPQGWRVGILICYDNNIIENARMTALQGAEILMAPHQTGGCKSPSPRCMGLIDVALWENRKENPEAMEAEFKGKKGREWLMRWLPARAHDNGMFYLFSNGVGRDDNEVRTGNAMILDCYGEVLVETWKADDDMVIATLEGSRLLNCTGRRWIKSRRPELYKPLTESTGTEVDTRTVRFSTFE